LGELSSGVGVEPAKNAQLVKNEKKVRGFILIWGKGFALREEFTGVVERMCLLELPYDSLDAYSNSGDNPGSHYLVSISALRERVTLGRSTDFFLRQTLQYIFDLCGRVILCHSYCFCLRQTLQYISSNYFTVGSICAIANLTIVLSETESEPFLKEADDASSDIIHAALKKTPGDIDHFTIGWRNLSIFLSYALAIFITCLFWVSTLFVVPKLSNLSFPWQYSEYNSTLLPGRNYYHCGDDSEAEKARGCQYDILNNHWVPAKCIDHQAIKKYQAHGTWFGYADRNHTDLISVK
jgi:hypothetical protein